MAINEEKELKSPPIPTPTNRNRCHYRCYRKLTNNLSLDIPKLITMGVLSLKSASAAFSNLTLTSNSNSNSNFQNSNINNSSTSTIMPSLASSSSSSSVVATNVSFTSLKNLSKNISDWIISTSSTPIRNDLPASEGTTTETISIISKNQNHNNESEGSTDDIFFILIPILLILTLAFLSGFALMCMQRRQKLDRLRHRLIPIYTFTHDEDDEWGVLIDNDRNAINQQQMQQQQQQPSSPQSQIQSQRKSHHKFGRK